MGRRTGSHLSFLPLWTRLEGATKGHSASLEHVGSSLTVWWTHSNANIFPQNSWFVLHCEGRRGGWFEKQHHESAGSVHIKTSINNPLGTKPQNARPNVFFFFFQREIFFYLAKHLVNFFGGKSNLPNLCTKTTFQIRWRLEWWCLPLSASLSTSWPQP